MTYRMPFGKYVGHDIEDVPKAYLTFLLAHGKAGRARGAILAHLNGDGKTWHER